MSRTHIFYSAAQHTNDKLFRKKVSIMNGEYIPRADSLRERVSLWWMILKIRISLFRRKMEPSEKMRYRKLNRMEQLIENH